MHVCLCMCIFYVRNAKRQLNLLPLITGIVQPQKKTHPISCDMAVTSCGLVFMDAVPVTLLISWFVYVCEKEFIGFLVALLPLHWQVDYQEKTEIVSASTWKRDWELCDLIITKTKCSVNDGKMWIVTAFELNLRFISGFRCVCVYVCMCLLHRSRTSF